MHATHTIHNISVKANDSLPLMHPPYAKWHPPPPHPIRLNCVQIFSYTTTERIMSKELEGWNIQHVTPIWLFHVHYGGLRNCCRTWFIFPHQLPCQLHLRNPWPKQLHPDVEKIPNRFVTPAPLPFFCRIEIAAEPACSLLMQLPCQPLSISASLPDTNWLSPQIDGLVLPLGLGRFGVGGCVGLGLVLQTSLTVLDNLLKRVFPWMLPFLLASSFLIHLTYCLQSQKAAWGNFYFFWSKKVKFWSLFNSACCFTIWHFTLLENCKWCCASPCRTWGYLWMDGLGKEFWLFVLELMDVHLLG